MSGEAVTVTQADREAAAAYMGRVKPWLSLPEISAGNWDDSPIVQAFARHRQSPAPTAGDELVERQGQIELWFFRDLFDAHRDALLALCFGAGVADEAKNNQHAQRLLLRKLLAATRIQSDAATIADLTARLAEVEALVERLHDAPKIEFYQQDWMPGFAAFLPDRTTPSPDGKAFCVLNVGALVASVATGDINRADLPYVIADSIVHELVHVLEQWADVEFDEDRTEAVIERYRAVALKEASDAAE